MRQLGRLLFNRVLTLSCTATLLLLCVICWDPKTGFLPASPQAQAHADAPPVPAEKVLNADLIRVGISDDAMESFEYPETRLGATGAFKITDQGTGKVVFNGTAGQTATMTVDKSGFSVTGLAARVPGPLVAETLSPDSFLKIASITRKGKAPEYKGTLEVLRGFSSPNKLSVVNVLPLQDYLKAVVPNELPARYGQEAVRAQAVAARNYAIRPREKPWPQFDICDSQYCQVYFGAHTETAETNRAILETQGLIALYDGEPILALFSSAHGGVAEDYSNAFSDPKTKQFPAPPIAYLKGGPDLPDKLPDLNADLRTEAAARAYWLNPAILSFDITSPHYRWEKQWTRAELETTINRGLLAVSKESFTKDFVSPLFRPGQTIGTLKHIEVKQRGISGKAMVVEIEGSHGRWTIQKEFVIRKVLQHNGHMLPSANIVVSHLTDPQGNLVGIRVNGGGFGHGVGMSQLGASRMDKLGFGFSDIIQHYYRGVALGTLPLKVGQGTANLPVKTEFYAKKPQGVLHVEVQEPGAPVKIRLNERDMAIATESSKQVIADVGSFLQTNTLNTLLLYPDATAPQRAIKAWIELVPPKSSDGLTAKAEPTHATR